VASSCIGPATSALLLSPTKLSPATNRSTGAGLVPGISYRDVKHVEVAFAVLQAPGKRHAGAGLLFFHRGINRRGLDSPMTSPTFTIGAAGSCENSASASPTQARADVRSKRQSTRYFVITHRALTDRRSRAS